MLHPRHTCNFHTIDVRVYSVIFHSFTYPFSHNHGSVENHPKNERKLILEIHPFSTKKPDYGRKGKDDYRYMILFNLSDDISFF